MWTYIHITCLVYMNYQYGIFLNQVGDLETIITMFLIFSNHNEYKLIAVTVLNLKFHSDTFQAIIENKN